MTDLEHLDVLLRSVDPAANLDRDPNGETGQRLFHRARQSQTRSLASSRSWRIPLRRLALVAAVLTLAVAGGVVAIAEIFQEATPLPDQPNFLRSCFELTDSCRDAVLADIQENGSDFERSVASDRLVSEPEYRQAAENVISCAGDLEVEAIRNEVGTGWSYGFWTKGPDATNQVERCMRDEFDRIHQLWEFQRSKPPSE